MHVTRRYRPDQPQAIRLAQREHDERSAPTCRPPDRTLAQFDRQVERIGADQRAIGKHTFDLGKGDVMREAFGAVACIPVKTVDAEPVHRVKMAFVHTFVNTSMGGAKAIASRAVGLAYGARGVGLCD